MKKIFNLILLMFFVICFESCAITKPLVPKWTTDPRVEVVNEQTVNNLGRRTIDIDNASYVIIIDRNKKKTLYIDNYKINNLVISEILDRVCRIESYYKYINI